MGNASSSLVHCVQTQRQIHMPALYLASSLRLWGLILGCALSAAVLPISEARACACCGTYKVVNVEGWDVLNVRSGPGTEYQIVYRLAPDEGCVILTGKRSGTWVGIEAQGVTGWVKSRYLEYIP